MRRQSSDQYKILHFYACYNQDERPRIDSTCLFFSLKISATYQQSKSFLHSCLRDPVAKVSATEVAERHAARSNLFASFLDVDSIGVELLQ